MKAKNISTVLLISAVLFLFSKISLAQNEIEHIPNKYKLVVSENKTDSLKKDSSDIFARKIYRNTISAEKRDSTENNKIHRDDQSKYQRKKYIREDSKEDQNQ